MMLVAIGRCRQRLGANGLSRRGGTAQMEPGLLLGFLYYYLCYRMHSGCHCTGTTAKPFHPGW